MPLSGITPPQQQLLGAPAAANSLCCLECILFKAVVPVAAQAVDDARWTQLAQVTQEFPSVSSIAIPDEGLEGRAVYEGLEGVKTVMALQKQHGVNHTAE